MKNIHIIIFITIFIIIGYILLNSKSKNKQLNKNSDETNCKYVSSRGILKSCDIHSFNPKSSIKKLDNYDFSKLKENCSIYVCTSAIPEFVKMIDKINVKFYLVSGDADESCPIDIMSDEEFIKFIENEKIIKWFAQNCVREHPKLFKLPIGLDYHSIIGGQILQPIEHEKMMVDVINSAKPFYEREIKCYVNFLYGSLFSTIKFGYDRKDAIDKIPSNLIYAEQSRVNRYDSFNNQIKYAFVISPHGNGLDCHRTWEALCTGSIPIVKTSAIDSLFTDLPVLIVKDWSDVNMELLTKTIKEFKTKKFNYDKLLLKYWIDKIKS